MNEFLTIFKIFNIEIIIYNQILFELSYKMIFKIFKQYLAILSVKNYDLVPNFLNALLFIPFEYVNLSIVFFQFFDIYLEFFNNLIVNFNDSKVSIDIVQLTKEIAKVIFKFKFV